MIMLSKKCVFKNKMKMVFRAKCNFYPWYLLP